MALPTDQKVGGSSPSERATQTGLVGNPGEACCRRGRGNSSEEVSLGVRLSPDLEHGREVADRSDLRRASIDDRKHALKDLGGVKSGLPF